MSVSDINSNEKKQRNGNGNSKQDQYKVIQYNQMLDESKHTDAHDVSNCDFTETQSQETMRNLHIEQKELAEAKKSS
jgi:acetylglutamate synthase